MPQDAAPLAAGARQLAGERPALRLKLPDHDEYPRVARARHAVGSRAVAAATDGGAGGSVLLEVPPWPGGAPAALALTFDDGSPEQLEKLTPLCARLNATCTLFLSPSFGGGVPWAQLDTALRADNGAERIRAAAAAAWAPKAGFADALAAFRAGGNELGAHTLYHKDVCAEAPEPAWWSFDGDVSDFDTVATFALGVFPDEVPTFAYPFGSACAAARATGAERYLAMRTTRCDAVDAGRRGWMQALPACELHPDGAAALKRARFTALASRALLVTYAHGLDGAGWRPVSGEFIADALRPFRTDGFWLCGLAACVRHLRMRECVIVAPAPPVANAQRATPHEPDVDAPAVFVDATGCDVALADWTLCGRWLGAEVPADAEGPLLRWWGGPPLRRNASLSGGPRTACWTLPRGAGRVAVEGTTVAL